MLLKIGKDGHWEKIGTVYAVYCVLLVIERLSKIKAEDGGPQPTSGVSSLELHVLLQKREKSVRQVVNINMTAFNTVTRMLRTVMRHGIEI